MAKSSLLFVGTLLESMEKDMFNRAEQGDAEAMMVIGKFYGQQNRRDDAYPWFEKAAANGHVEAITALADYYADPCGLDTVVYNEPKAVELYQQAIERGSVTAMCGLADVLRRGWEVEQDLKSAFELFRCAADNDDPHGCYETAVCCYYGLGTRRDMEQAAYYALCAYRQLTRKPLFYINEDR